MNEVRLLRPVQAADREPLGREEMQARGNQLARDARVAAINAMRYSAVPDFYEHPSGVNPAVLRKWRSQAQRAITEWLKAERLLSELLAELDLIRDRDRQRRSHTPSKETP